MDATEILRRGPLTCASVGADDGIRTRDPHLGKVMRYQLRYIRAPRTRSSSGAKHDDSRRERAHTNFLVRAASRLSRRTGDVQAAGTVETRLVLVFDVVRLSAPVPWLSGRASASHAEGRWFDPSRDHKRWRRSEPALGRFFESVPTACQMP